MNNEWQHLVDEINRLRGLFEAQKIKTVSNARQADDYLKEVERLRAEINSRREDALDTEAKVERLRAALTVAREDIVHWVGYASDYFKDKHDYVGDLAAIDAALEDKPAHPCDNGCQYSKDVGMWPEHSCGNGCMYDKAALEDKP